MAAADEAYAEALRLIAEAQQTGATEIRFDDDRTVALNRIPAEIVQLAGLTRLDLRGTPVGDISPLTQLAGLTDLAFDVWICGRCWR